MKKAKKPSFNMTDAGTLVLANDVATALVGNAFFPVPKVSMADLQTGINTYSESLFKSKHGSLADKAQKNADKQALIELLRTECDYVNDIAQGSEVILTTCGYLLSKNRQPKVLGTPQASVENGATAELILSTPAVPGAVAYKHQYTTDASAALWHEVTTTRAVCKIPNLVLGQTYSLRIVAVGTNDQTKISPVVTKVAA